MWKILTRKLKETNIDWIGEVPENWEISTIGSHYTERTDKVSDLDYIPLSVTKSGIVPQLEIAAKSSNHDNRKLVLKDDFVINSRSDRKMSAGISSIDGSVSVINTVLYSNTIDRNYTKYLLKNYAFAEEFYKWGTGIVDDLWSTKWLKMKNIPIPVPSSEKQKQIGSVIDSMVQNTNNIINGTKESISELKKYKQSLITESVTKGLDPNVEMKDSGIEWVRDVPKNWEVKPIKYSVNERKEQLNSQMNPYDEINYVDISSVSYTKGVEKIESLKFKDAPSRARKIVYHNDIIISTVRTYLKSIDRINYNIPLIVSTGFCVLKPRNHISANFLEYAIKSDYFTNQVEQFSTGIAYPSITSRALLSLNFIEPPLNEQQEIFKYLNDKVDTIDRLIEDKTKVVEELENYKNSLIYEYVTGKKEV